MYKFEELVFQSWGNPYYHTLSNLVYRMRYTKLEEKSQLRYCEVKADYEEITVTEFMIQLYFA